MSNERATFTISLPFDHTIELREYITGYEWEEIVGIYRKGTSAKEDDDVVRIRADKRLYEMLVVAVDGKTENTYDAVRTLPKPAYDAATTAVTDTMEGKKNQRATRLLRLNRRTKDRPFDA